MVWNASDTSPKAKTLAFVSRGSFSLMAGIVYLGLLIVLFIVWLGSIQMRSLPFGFSLTNMLDSQSVGWVTGLIIPFSQSLFISSFTGPNYATGTGCVVACTGLTEGSNSICIGVRGVSAPRSKHIGILPWNVLRQQHSERRRCLRSLQNPVLNYVCFVCINLQILQSLRIPFAEKWWFVHGTANTRKSIVCSMPFLYSFAN